MIDTYLLVQLYDITVREMTGYGLKDVAVHFGITPESGEEPDLYRRRANPTRLPH